VSLRFSQHVDKIQTLSESSVTIVLWQRRQYNTCILKCACITTGNGPYDYSPSSKLSFHVFQLVGGSVTFRAIYNVTEDDPKLYWGITKGSSALNDSAIESFHRSDRVFITTNVYANIDLLDQTFDGIEVRAAIIQKVPESMVKLLLSKSVERQSLPWYRRNIARALPQSVQM
jgi:hypothetical protein